MASVVSDYISMHMCTVPAKDRRGHQSSWAWSRVGARLEYWSSGRATRTLNR